MKKNELQTAWERAYSIESMAGHDAEGRSLEYIGGMIGGYGSVYDFYRDNTGDYWYSVRLETATGELVPEEEAIFGHAIRRRYA